MLSRFFRDKVPDDRIADLVQKTMLGAVESRDRVPAELEFRVYLLGIARRVLVTWLRQSKRSMRGRKDAVSEGTPAGDVTPSRAVAQAAEQRLLLQALRRLPLELQLVVELHYWEDLGTRAIAEVMGVPQGTVKSRLRRAREQLQATVEQLTDDPALRESTVGNLEHWAGSLRDQSGEGADRE